MSIEYNILHHFAQCNQHFFAKLLNRFAYWRGAQTHWSSIHPFYYYSYSLGVISTYYGTWLAFMFVAKHILPLTLIIALSFTSTSTLCWQHKTHEHHHGTFRDRTRWIGDLNCNSSINVDVMAVPFNKQRQCDYERKRANMRETVRGWGLGRDSSNATDDRPDRWPIDGIKWHWHTCRACKTNLNITDQCLPTDDNTLCCLKISNRSRILWWICWNAVKPAERVEAELCLPNDTGRTAESEYYHNIMQLN